MLDLIPVWILVTLFAGTMQSIRTAAQKRMTAGAAQTGREPVSVASATYVRALYGLPFAALYLLVLHLVHGFGTPNFSVSFFVNTLLGALSQMAATLFLVMSFRFRSFAVATAYSKSEVILTALVAVTLFATPLSALGWVAVLVTSLGLVFITLAKTGFSTNVFKEPAVLMGLAAGFCFAFSSLFIRDASLALNSGWLWRDAAWTLFTLLLFQAIILFVWLAVREPKAQEKLKAVQGLCVFVGLTSCLGSIGWFTAFTLANPAYVRAVGQVEMLIALSITAFYFREKMKALEVVGILVLVAGMLAFFLIPA